MANSKTDTDYLQYATVDTAPGVDGYWTTELNIRSKKVSHAYFSVRGTGVMTVVLQFKAVGDTTWTDYATTTDNGRAALKGGGAGVKWRAGVKQAGRTSGSKIFGFDW